MKGSASRLRANFLAVVVGARLRRRLLAKRLDLALNNMSHGLMMIDAEGRVTVVNRQLLNLFRLDADDVQSGASLRAMARTLMRRKIVAQERDRAGVEDAGARRRRDRRASRRSRRATTARSKSPSIA